MGMEPIERLCMGADYEHVSALVVDTVRRYHSRYGGDKEEMHSEALVIFCEAWKKYNAERNALFSTWVSYRIFWTLFDRFHKKRSRRDNVAKILELDTLDVTPIITDDSPLSKEADRVVRLVLDRPPYLAKMVEACPSPIGWRRSLRKYLTTVGWTKKQIDSAFAEIREYLKECQ